MEFIVLEERMDFWQTDLPLHLFHHGENFKAYELMGAHKAVVNKKSGYVFRVWAPRAQSVSVVGEFNDWNPDSHPMKKMIDNETFELFIPALKEFTAYKYCIKTEDGRTLFKADPYAFHSETPKTESSNASKLYDLSGFKWTDKVYLDKQKHKNIYASPINVYEVNLLSWKMHDDGTYYTYRELAVELVDYVAKMGYTHVEFMPVTEHPFDGSWGYQVTGYYSITSRLGTPHDFMYLVNAFHKADIGVILDWVPAHFPKDAFGLYEFDGKPLYEASQWDRMENRGWGTRMFDFGRKEVVSFLISSAMFFLEKFHIDGLRVDAVASMLYLDYDKKEGEWVPNIYGENKNLEAIAFLRRLNEAVFSFFPNILMIAEESTAWPIITRPTSMGGLGFNYKWNMGWMNDVLSYISTNPLFRKYNHNKLTFSMMYAFSENYVLPISHDEVVHGKASLIGKMPGEYEEKFAAVRSFMGYMMAHPGKKLHFMGSEIGQFKEWNYKEGIEFFLTQYPLHAKLQTAVRELNELYKTTPALYEIEDSWDGFEWLAPDDADRNFLAFQRKDKAGNAVVVMINFSGSDYYGYRLGLPKGKYRVIYNSDSTRYGGKGNFKKLIFNTTKTYSHGKEYSIFFDLPKLTCVYLKKIN
ncbi:MAG: 1,4-alpha-glucan branching protein GlgB [Clostridiales bacterium]|nr:1,4-alpha-glucan branching protein GlgB [Clostridiales bacterium]